MKKLVRFLIPAIAAMALAAGCQQATTPGPAPLTVKTLDANQVSVTVAGLVFDGLGNPLGGVDVGYSDGDNPAVSTRSLQNAVSNDKGQFELAITNSAFIGSSNQTWIVLGKSGYTSLKYRITLPAFGAVTAQSYTFTVDGKTYTYPLNVGATQTVTTTQSSTAPGVSTTTQSSVTPLVTGFKVATDIGHNYLFQLAGEATGKVLLLNDAADPVGKASVPPAGSIVAFSLPGSNWSPYIIEAKTDANGVFTFSGTGSAATPDGKPNPLPIFAIVAGSANNVFPYTGTSTAPMISVRAGTNGAPSDTTGMGLYVIEPTVNPGITNFSILPPNGADKYINQLGNNDGNLYAVADRKVQVTGWTPLTLSSGTNLYMDQLTGGTPTPVTISFSKKMDTANTPVSGIKWVGYNPGNLLPTLSWDTAATTATITPAVPFPKNSTVSLYLQGWLASDGNPLSGFSYANVSKTIDFNVRPGLTFMRGSWTDNLGAAKYVALSATSVSLIFNNAPASFDASKCKLWDTTSNAEVTATFTIDATNKALVATVQQTLYPAHVYEVRFSVSSNILGEADPAYTGAPSNSACQFTVDPTSALKVLASNAWTSGQTPTTTYSIAAPLTVTFSKAVVTSPAPTFVLFQDNGAGGGVIGNGVQDGTEAAIISQVTTADNLTFTITPVATLAPGTRYGLSYNAYSAADKTVFAKAGGAVADPGAKVYFTTSPDVGINLVASNTFKTGVLPTDAFPLSGTNIVLTFDNPIAATPAPTFTLFSDNGAGGGVIGNGLQDGTEPGIQTTATLSNLNKTVTLAVANAVPFNYGQKLGVGYTVYASSTGAAYSNIGAGTAPRLPFAALSAVAPKLVSSNTWITGYVPTTTFPISGTNISLIFDSAIYYNAGNLADAKNPVIAFFEDNGAGGGIANNGVRDGTEALVQAGYSYTAPTLAVPTSTLAIIPQPGTGSLKYNMPYGATYTVFSPLDTTKSATGYVTLTTLKPARLATPTLVLDNTGKLQADAVSAKPSYQRGNYAFGETSVYLSLGYVANVDSYDWQYKFTTDLAWTTGGNISVTTTPTDGVTPYAVSVIVPGLDPSKQSLLVRARANTIGGFDAAVSSDWQAVPVTVSITQRPSVIANVALPGNLGIPGLAGGFLFAPVGSVTTWTQTIAIDATQDRYFGIGFNLNGTETMTKVDAATSIANGTPAPSNFSIYSVIMSPDNKTAFVIIKVPINLKPTGEFRISVRDAAGLLYDSGTSIGTDDYISLTVQ